MVPSLHRKYIANMVGMFGDCALHGAATLQRAHQVSLFLLSKRLLRHCMLTGQALIVVLLCKRALLEGDNL